MCLNLVIVGIVVIGEIWLFFIREKGGSWRKKLGSLSLDLDSEKQRGVEVKTRLPFCHFQRWGSFP